MITIAELRVRDASDAWRAAGFEVVDNVCTVGGVRIRLEQGPAGEHGGFIGWTLRGVPESINEVDGIPTAVDVPAGPATAEPIRHPNGAHRIDHVVLMTPGIERTVSAVTSLGLEVRRERDAGAFQQVFFRLGAEILEVVGPQEAGPGPASLWGATFVVDDLEATAALLGDRVGRVKDAVQPGRRITTLRGREVGIGPAIAFMSA